MKEENFKFEFNRHRINKIPQSKAVEELKRVAEIYDYRCFTRHEFDKVAKVCKGTTILNIFRTWPKALDAIGKPLEKRKVDRSIIPINSLFEEMERIWRLIGHRPSKDEWVISKPKYSYTTYKTRFKGWTNACLKFIENKMGQSIFEDTTNGSIKPQIRKLNSGKIEYASEDLRTIPLKIRIKVLERDRFCCVFCGRSPATDIGVRLHIDHKMPFSKSGKSTIDNLQTLCQDCNRGKSDEVIGSPKI
jgi:hypothetical protein